MFNSSKKNEIGEGLFEMLLCIPLALLLLFTGVDVGLSKLDNALVTDAVREGIHNQVTNNSRIYRVVRGVVTIDQGVVVDTANSMADRIAQNVSSKRLSLASNDGKNQIKVSVTPVHLDINPQTGAVENYQRGQEVLSQFGNPSLSIGQSASSAPSSTDDQFISTQIQEAQSRGGFGIVRPSYGAAQNQDRFLDAGVAYLISVDVMSPSINPAWLSANLGSELGYQIKELQIIRN